MWDGEWRFCRLATDRKIETESSSTTLAHKLLRPQETQVHAGSQSRIGYWIVCRSQEEVNLLYALNLTESFSWMQRTSLSHENPPLQPSWKSSSKFISLPFHMEVSLFRTHRVGYSRSSKAILVHLKIPSLKHRDLPRIMIKK